ncbi:PPOX class F420-dependent oxidoreductase [Saccharothrix algeriensis]|uniref:PPOX class probable F420-dependent enzyme n=1 Tax=Saccharothrix algeriensis TaxID=173560 RepID=A0ABS2SEY1_9PSEU|nr:PPOX class F420-dependent oxidoreductase [Saccharothrix algeriensis]MBM7813611.1 PPOX class probable F420-dependent enzyme [Saccharothrix algeriensis]
MGLGDEKYLLLTTFRRTGAPVPTPVWAVRRDGVIHVWSAADAGKVKRIRNNPEVTVGPCDFRGNPTGDSSPARARLLDERGSEETRRLIAGKYGVLGRLTLLGSRLRRGREGTVGIAITLDPASAPR